MSKKYLFDNKKNVNRVIHSLWAICVLLVILDFILHRHVSHPFENLPAFYPLYGFIGCVLLVIIAKWMRAILMRPESYYDNQNETHNTPPKDGPDHVDT